MDDTDPWVCLVLDEEVVPSVSWAVGMGIGAMHVDSDNVLTAASVGSESEDELLTASSCSCVVVCWWCM